MGEQKQGLSDSQGGPSSPLANEGGENTGGATGHSGWTPRRQGDIYCSPRCGCHCKWDAYQLATAEAAQLAAVMGEGWGPHVWENGGWHYYAVKGDGGHHAGLAEIHPNKGPASERAYSAWINPVTEGVMQVITDWVADPVEALGLAMQEARTRALRFDGELDFISNGGAAA